MHQYHETQQSPYSSQQLFDLVMDIERYPAFLPWCRASRIIEKTDEKVIAELVISFKHITESYTSEIRFRRPEHDKDTGFVDVVMLRGPFEKLENHWKFNPVAEGGCEIILDLSFKFRSRLLDSIIGLLFGKATAKMVGAFKQRADSLYQK